MTESSPTRGEVWWVDFEPARGSEPRKMRPAVVVNSASYDYLPLRIVVPLTTWQPRFENQPNKVSVERTVRNGLPLDSAADAVLIRVASIERFEEKLGEVDAGVLAEIVAAIVVLIEA